MLVFAPLLANKAAVIKKSAQSKHLSARGSRAVRNIRLAPVHSGITARHAYLDSDVGSIAADTNEF